MLTICDLLAAVANLSGYVVLAALSYITREHYCWGYLLVSFATLLHGAVVLVRYAKRIKRAANRRRHQGTGRPSSHKIHPHAVRSADLNRQR